MATGADRKFYVLDAMRGIAALAVVQFHTAVLFGGLWFRHAFLAVDFFFMLSGFVLAFAYQERLDRGWPDGAFLKVRVIRLYPLYFLALLLGVALYGFRNDFGRHAGEITNLKVLVGFALLFLPVPPGIIGAGGFNFPLNPPTWSLFFELLANFGHALVLRRRSTRQLAFLVCACCSALVACARHAGTINCGVSQDKFLYGLTRIAFSYTAGILLCSCWTRWKPSWNISPFISAGLLLAVLIGPARASIFYDLAGILLAFPAILYLGASSQPQSWLVRPTHWMGIASYAIYVLHYPLFQWLFFLQSKLHNSHAFPTPLTGILFLCLLVLSAAAADRFYDNPIRRFLTARSLRAHSDPVLQASPETVL